MSATIGVAVVGAGHWGPNLITNFHRDRRSDVRWVVDRDARRLSQVEEVFPELRTTEQLETALDDPSVDAVVIATSTSTPSSAIASSAPPSSWLSTFERWGSTV